MQYIVSKKKIGERLKNLRQEAKKSQAEVSELFGLSRSHYSQVELGKQFPSYDVLTNIATYYGKTYEWLLHGKEILNNKMDTKEQIVNLENFVNSQSVYEDVMNSNIISDIHLNSSILFIAVSEQATYLNSRTNAEYLSNLPEIRLPNLGSKGEFRGFEIEGDSMEILLRHRDIAIGRCVFSLNEVIFGAVYIFVKDQVISVRRLLSYAEEMNSFICKADGEGYKQEVVALDTIRELWQLEASVSIDLMNLVERLSPPSANLLRATMKLREEVR